MLTDREKLELAAKAMGKTLDWNGGEPYLKHEGAERPLGVGGCSWNPLNRNEDAFELLVFFLHWGMLNSAAGHEFPDAVNAALDPVLDVLTSGDQAKVRTAVLDVVAAIGGTMP